MQKFDYHWRKAINIPAWVIQLIACIFLIGAGALVLVGTNDTKVKSAASQSQNGNAVLGAFNGVAGAYIGIGALTFIFVIVEIIMCSRKTMKPALYLSFACIKTLIWLVIFIAACLARAGLSIFVDLVILAACIMQLAYGASVVHRNRKGTLSRGKYAAAATGHVEGALYNPHLAAVPAPTQYGYAGNTNTEYKSPVPSPAPEQQYGYNAPAPAHQSYYSPDSYGQQQQQQQQYYQQPQAGTYEMQNRPHH